MIQFQYQIKTESPPAVLFVPSFGWRQVLSEPVRKSVIATALIAPCFAYVTFIPEPITQDKWFHAWENPVWSKPGLKVSLQQFTALPSRYLPTPNITMVMAATEVDTDSALFGLQVYDSSTPSTGVAGASVSIVEIQSPTDGAAAMSIREP